MDAFSNCLHIQFPQLCYAITTHYNVTIEIKGGDDFTEKIAFQSSSTLITRLLTVPCEDTESMYDMIISFQHLYLGTTYSANFSTFLKKKKF